MPLWGSSFHHGALGGTFNIQTNIQKTALSHGGMPPIPKSLPICANMGETECDFKTFLSGASSNSHVKVGLCVRESTVPLTLKFRLLQVGNLNQRSGFLSGWSYGALSAILHSLTLARHCVHLSRMGSHIQCRCYSACGLCGF